MKRLLFDTANLMTSANITLNYNEAHGHVDHVFSRDHLHEVEHPVLKWSQGVTK